MIVCIKPRLCREILSQLSAILSIRQPTSTNYLSYTMVLNEHKKGRAQKKQAGFYEGQKVALLISDRTDMGFIALINGTEKGILYKSEVFQPLKIGQEIDGFIKKVRDDKKIDLCLQNSAIMLSVHCPKKLWINYSNGVDLLRSPIKVSRK